LDPGRGVKRHQKMAPRRTPFRRIAPSDFGKYLLRMESGLG